MGAKKSSGRQVVGPNTKLYPGLHEPIIPGGVWDRVQQMMNRAQRGVSAKWTHTHLLKGKLRTIQGGEDHAMSPSSVVRVRKGGVRQQVAYYISQKALKQGFKSCSVKTMHAGHLDNLVRGVALNHLRAAHKLDFRPLQPEVRDMWIREVIHRVVLAPGALTIELVDDRVGACAQALMAAPKSPGATSNDQTIPSCPFNPTAEPWERGTRLSLAIQIKRHDGRRILLSPDGQDLLVSVQPDGQPVPRAHLVRAIGQAFAWHNRLLKSGEPIDLLAGELGMNPARVQALLVLTQLSPAILKAALTGTLGASVSLADLQRAAVHLDWSLQAAALGR